MAMAAVVGMDLCHPFSCVAAAGPAAVAARIRASPGGGVLRGTGRGLLIPLKLGADEAERRFEACGNRRRGRGAELAYGLVYSSKGVGPNGWARAKVDGGEAAPAAAGGGLLAFPRAVWKQVLGPLSNFGFGKRSVGEGGVGLFVMSGVVLLAVVLVWVKGKQIRARTRRYEAVFEFQQAQGITVGTPVRIRGVDVGNVVAVRPSLERIDVVVELAESGIVIPRNARVEVNQSGLISETLIDVTPRRPLPRPTVGPTDPRCPAEGLIVCDRERIRGDQGVSLDELVGICTKIARQIDALGVERVAGMAERLGDAVQEARPLLAKVQSMAGDIEPLLKEARDGGLFKDFESLTRVAAEAGRDLSKLNKEVLTSDNTNLLRDSVSTLTKTLKHVESISKDVSGVTGDAKTRNNLKQLIESLSRLVAD